MTHESPLDLSVREREIVSARARGRSYKEIASDLSISINTVKTHLSRVFIKLDVQCSLDLLRVMQKDDCLHCPFLSSSSRSTARSRRLSLAASRPRP